MESIIYCKYMSGFDISLLDSNTYVLPGYRHVYIKDYQKFPKREKRRARLINKLSRVYRNIFHTLPILVGDFDGDVLDFSKLGVVERRREPLQPGELLDLSGFKGKGITKEEFAKAFVPIKLDPPLVSHDLPDRLKRLIELGENINRPSIEELLKDGIKRL